jgi:O-antigen/teichoic acid export membrane protein
VNRDAAAHQRHDAGGETLTVARNVSTRYLAIGVEAILVLVVLPFNVAHLGTAAYGLWMLTASVTAYFSVLALGYSGALVKFVAQYRARRDFDGLNQILSTMFAIFASFGVITITRRDRRRDLHGAVALTVAGPGARGRIVP